MSLAARIASAALVVAAACLAVASLALLDVVPGWGVLFFYVVPTFFFGVWALRELQADVWRRTVTPLRRVWRLSRLGSPPPPPDLPAPPPKPTQADVKEKAEEAPATVFAAAAGLWLRLMRALLSLRRSTRVRRTFNVVFGVAAAALGALVAWQLSSNGWPLGQARALWTAAAVAFFLSTFALRALAWQRLFRPRERPRSLALVASNATAATAAIALPSRVDDAIAILVLRKLSRRKPPSVGTLALSLFLLGLMDMAALTPFAVFAAVAVPGSVGVRVTMLVLTGICVGAGLLALALPSIRRSDRLIRYRLGHWLAVHAPASRLDALWAWLLVACSWLTRVAGLFVLLDALGLDANFSVAASYVVAGAGAAALPIGPAGQATQAGVGAAVLAGSGIHTKEAVTIALAAQLLTVTAAAVIAGFSIAAHMTGTRLRRGPA